jgi:PhnB protein
VVNPVPDGYAQVTPYLCVDGASEAIMFYIQAFGAKELSRSTTPGGKIAHAQVQIGDSILMLVDEFPGSGTRAAKAIGDTPVTLYLYVDDADAVFARALRAGARERRPVRDQFFGDRAGQLDDPFGHRWTVATHVEDVSPDEFERRAAQHMRAMP